MPVRLLFLDRDGTLNRTLGRRPPNAPDEVELLPGVEAVLSRYVSDGWRLVIVTNQGGVGAGYLTEAQAHAVQQRVIDLLPVPVSASYLCPHMPGGAVPEYAIDCPNRKPRPGFVLNALCAFEARPGDCLLVGDAITDKQVAEAAGVPFRWADRFFGRPIDRGLHALDGSWVQVRQVGELDPLGGPAGADRDMCLVAEKDGEIIGRLCLLRAQGAANWTLDVGDAHRGTGIEALLAQTALEWIGDRQELRRSVADLLTGLSSEG
ncbi:MAG: GNAT family N-acetyltransferase [Anaerolineae bacterium]|nr:GNAT family N-acetyltransferase [Anaerolineae bacterium]